MYAGEPHLGPLLVLDKSTLQALSRNEIHYLFKHYMLLVPPVLLYEILSDIKKTPKRRMIPREEVTWLAKKILSADAMVSVHYQEACISSLFGAEPPEGRIPVTGGHEVTAPDGTKGFFLDEQPEREMLRNWAQGTFSEADEKMAEYWRTASQSLNLEAFQRAFSQRLKGAPSLTLLEIQDHLATQLAGPDPSFRMDVLTGLLDFLGVPLEVRTQIFQRWIKLGMPAFESFAPYADFCMKTYMLFLYGIAFKLITPRRTNIVDLQYIFYTWFTMAFSSRDSLHRLIAPVFLKPAKSFIDGDHLKADLARLAKEWEGLSEEERTHRAEEYGSHPYPCEGSVTYQVWCKHMRPWQPGSGNRAGKMTKEEESALLERIRGITEAAERQIRFKQ